MNTQELVSSIYAASLSPHRFHETTAEMELRVMSLVRAVSGIEDFGEVLPEDRGYQIDPQVLESLYEHVENALAIQARLALVPQDGNSRMEAMLETMPNPSVIFDKSENILRSNEHARRQLRKNPGTLASIFKDEAQLKQLRAAIATLRVGSEFASLPMQLSMERKQSTCVLLKRIAALDANDTGKALYILTIIDFAFTDEVGGMFRRTFNLTEAEAAVALLLASGLNPADIAARRSVSMQTVRAQIKTIKQKTNVRDIPDLVRLLCGFSTGLLVPTQFPGTATTVFRKTSASTRTLRLSDGRLMEYLVQGALQGEAVILFHNMPYGQILPAAAARQAAAAGLTIYCPVRAGCRSSDPLRGSGREHWLQAVCSDTLEFMNEIGIEKAQLLGNVAGSTFTVRFASLHPERVSAIVMVSRAPIWRKIWLGELSTSHRLLSMLLWLMPKMAELFLGSIVSYMKKHSADEYLRSAVRGSEPDLLALENSETAHLLGHGVLEGFAQGTVTFCKDWELMELDMTLEAAALAHPIHVVHGEHDRIINPQWIHEFAQSVPNATVNLVQHAGHYLFYSHWREVLDALEVNAIPVARKSLARTA